MTEADKKNAPAAKRHSEVDESRFEKVRRLAAERHRKSDTDGARRRALQTAEDNRLL